MAGGKAEEGIISLYNTDIAALYSINQISRLLDKAYPYVNHKVNSLIKEGVFKKIVVGRSILCGINLNSDRAVCALVSNEIQRKEALLKRERKLSSIMPELDRIKASFKIYTIFIVDGRLHFVLDYLNDKEAIKNSCPRVMAYSPEFYDIPSSLDSIRRGAGLDRDKVILYGFEKYFELLSRIEDTLVGMRMMR